MALKDYLPTRDPELDEWLDNYVAKLPTVAATIGISGNEVTDITNFATAFKNNLNTVGNKKAEVSAAVGQKNIVKKDLTDYLRPVNSRAKDHTGYTIAIGELLDMIGPDDGFDHDAYKPVLTAEVFPGNVKLEFKKASTDGVNIYTRMQGQPGWTFLARDTESPYIDNRPLKIADQPETREYSCRAVLSDEEIGQLSEIASAVFGG